ncbi:MAG: hypothetical protein R3194_04585, partial [Limnobacter sp.]|nr:hypothetical protein [Limnobacter sp.]
GKGIQRAHGRVENPISPSVTGYLQEVLSRSHQLGAFKGVSLSANSAALYSMGTSITNQLDDLSPETDAKDRFKTRLSAIRSSPFESQNAVHQTAQTMVKLFKSEFDGVNADTAKNANADDLSLNLLSMNLFLDGFRTVKASGLKELNAQTQTETVVRRVKQDMPGKADAFSKRVLMSSYSSLGAHKAENRALRLQEAGMIASRQFFSTNWSPESITTQHELGQHAVKLINGLSSEQRRVYDAEVSGLLDSIQSWEAASAEQNNKPSLAQKGHPFGLASPADIARVVEFKQQVFDTDLVALDRFSQTPDSGVAFNPDLRAKALNFADQVKKKSATVYGEQRKQRTLLQRFGTSASTIQRSLVLSQASSAKLSELKVFSKDNSNTPLIEELTQFKTSLSGLMQADHVLKAFSDATSDGKEALQVERDELLSNHKQLKTVNFVFNRASQAFSSDAVGNTSRVDFSEERLLKERSQYGKPAELAPKGVNGKNGLLMAFDQGLLAGDMRFTTGSAKLPPKAARASVVQLLGPLADLSRENSAQVSRVIELLNVKPVGDEALNTRINSLTEAEEILGDLSNKQLERRKNDTTQLTRDGLANDTWNRTSPLFAAAQGFINQEQTLTPGLPNSFEKGELEHIDSILKDMKPHGDNEVIYKAARNRYQEIIGQLADEASIDLARKLVQEGINLLSLEPRPRET